jgi:O-antigen/teichoic acid export membrane protein
VVIAFKLRPGLRIGRSYVNLKSIKTLYGYSVVILMNAMSDLLLFRTGDMLAGMFIGPVAVTYYAIAGTLTEYLQRIVLTMTMVLHPYSSAKEATGDAQGLRDAVVVGTKMCLLIGLPATILMLMIGHAFIAAWMGGNYAAVAAPILTVMAVARLAWVSQSGIGQILLGIGKHKQVTALNIVAGVTSFIGGYFMARHGGLYWMTVGSAVPLVVVHGFITPLFTSRVVGVPLGHYIGEGYLKPLLGVIPFAIALFALIETFPPHTLWAVAAVVLAAVPVYVLGVYFLSFSADERRTYLSMLAPSWLAAKS